MVQSLNVINLSAVEKALITTHKLCRNKLEYLKYSVGDSKTHWSKRRRAWSHWHIYLFTRWLLIIVINCGTLGCSAFEWQCKCWTLARLLFLTTLLNISILLWLLQLPYQENDFEQLLQRLNMLSNSFLQLSRFSKYCFEMLWSCP